MWLLYKIEKNFNYASTSYMRLRPGAQTALVPGTRHHGGVHVKVGPMSFEDTENASFKPMLKLLVQDLDVRVDNTSVEQETYLHDQQIIHLADSDIQYKICWERIGVYHLKSNDQDVHQQLMEAAKKYGFQLVDKMDKTTHYYLDAFLLEQKDQPPYSLLMALVMRVPCVTLEWLEGFRLHDHHYDRNQHDKTIEPIMIDYYGPLNRPAILGIDDRRKTLFHGLEFWFFDQLQYDKYSPLVRKTGGKSRIANLEEGLNATILHGTLFVQYPHLTEEWVPVQDKFHQNMDCNRCILEWEIEYSIMYCSTNMMCNPSSDLLNQISSDDPVYRSLESSLDRVKPEPLDVTVPIDMVSPMRDTVPMSMISPMRDTVPMNMISPLRDTVPLRDTLPINMVSPMRDTMLMRDTLPISNNISPIRNTTRSTLPMNTSSPLHDTLPISNHVSPMRNTIKSTLPIQDTIPIDDENEDKKESISCAYAASLQPSINLEEDDVDMDPPTPSLSVNLMDLSSFYDNMFATTAQKQQQQSKAKESQAKKKKEQEEKRKKEQEEQSGKEQEEHLRREQEEQLRIEREEQLRKEQEEEQRRKQQEQEQRKVQIAEREKILEERQERLRMVEEEKLKELDERRKRLAERQRQLGIEDEDDDTTETNDTTPAPTQINTSAQNTPSSSYSQVVFAPLVVKRRPPPTSTPQTSAVQSNGSIVNYKRFKKVRQFESNYAYDFVPMASSSQMPVNSRRHQNQEYNLVRIENTNQFDPDIMIRTTARRRR